MNTKNMQALLAATLLIAAVRPAVAQDSINAAAAQSGVTTQVLVNGQVVQFQGQPPIEQNGHLLVPLRGVLEKLGANVEFDSANQTVVAFRGQTRITLPIGSTTAQVNGQPITLDVAAQVVNGSTLVPLRFIAESLGAQVNFNVNNNSVNINMHSAEMPPPPNGQPRHNDGRAARREMDEKRAADARARADSAARALAEEQKRLATENAVVGTVVALYRNVSPARLVLHIPAMGGTPEGNRTIPIPGGVPVVMQQPNGPEMPVAMDHVGEGDLVSVLQNGDGNATAINIIGAPHGGPDFHGKPWVPTTFRGEFLGREPHDDQFRLRMVDGRTIDVPHTIPIVYRNHPVRPEDLRPGDILSITVDPKSHRGIRIVVNP